MENGIILLKPTKKERTFLSYLKKKQSYFISTPTELLNNGFKHRPNSAVSDSLSHRDQIAVKLEKVTSIDGVRPLPENRILQLVRKKLIAPDVWHQAVTINAENNLVLVRFIYNEDILHAKFIPIKKGIHRMILNETALPDG